MALDLSAAEAKAWHVQHALSTRLRKIVQKEQIIHAQIEAGTSRTSITAILNGNLEHVSSDLLIRILGSLGYRGRVSVTKAA